MMLKESDFILTMARSVHLGLACQVKLAMRMNMATHTCPVLGVQ